MADLDVLHEEGEEQEASALSPDQKSTSTVNSEHKDMPEDDKPQPAATKALGAFGAMFQRQTTAETGATSPVSAAESARSHFVRFAAAGLGIFRGGGKGDLVRYMCSSVVLLLSSGLVKWCVEPQPAHPRPHAG